MVLKNTTWPRRMLLFALFLTFASPSQAVEKATKAEKEQPSVKVISVTIHPAALPSPALKYHLLPTFLERTPGNAIPCYLKALLEHVDMWRRFIEHEGVGKESDLDHIQQWLEMPLDTMPSDRARKLVDVFNATEAQLKLAVRRERCEWDMPLRQGQIFEILLPEVQEFRNMARIVALRARLQIAEGKYAEAIASLQIGYGMARHIAEQPFLVSGLVGVTLANMMNAQLLTLCQQPGAPNLYWTITELPSPLIDRLKSIDAEYDGLYLQYPDLAAARHGQYAREQWDMLLRRFVAEMVHYDYEFNRTKLSDKDQAAKVAKIISGALEAVPRAKADLAAAGYLQKDLDAMPPAQIVVLHVLHTYETIRDEMFKWWHLPYWQANAGLEAFQRDFEAIKKKELVPTASPILRWGNIQLPTVASFARSDRELAALRCIEALRLYVAHHENKLPASLDEIKEVPIPINPMTGKAFGYRLDGQTAVLDCDGGPAQLQSQYRVTVAK